MANILIVHEDARIAQLIADAVEGSGGHRLAGRVMSSAECLSRVAGADLVVLSMKLPDGDGFSLINQIRTKKPAMGVVPVLQGSEGGDVWQRILQMNLRDVLVNPSDARDIQSKINSALMNLPSMSDAPGVASGYVMAVASARGGTGKSLFALNLALCMAQQSAECLLIDYSMTAGDFFMMLDQVPRHTLADAYSQGIGVDEILLRNLVSTHPLGFNYLACPNDDFDVYAFDYENAKTLLQVSRSLSPYIIVDTGVFDLPPTNAAVDVADLVYLLTTRDLARLMSLKRLIKNYTNRGMETDKLKVIVNNAEVGTEISEEEIEEFIEHPVTAYLPSIPLPTTFSINTGKPLAQVRPDEPLVSVLNKLAEISIQKWAG